MTKPFVALFGAGLFFASAQACSNSGSGKAVDDTPKVVPVVDSGADAGKGAIAVYDSNSTCTTSRWADVSDACWSCLCGTCADTLNKCNTDCVGILECAGTKHTFVNNPKQSSCELTATAATCLGTSGAVAAVGALITLDGCLLNAPNKTGFRACETECGITYSGDVCQRYGVDAGAGNN